MTQDIDDEIFDQICRALGCYGEIYDIVRDLRAIADKNKRNLALDREIEGLAKRLHEVVLKQKQALQYLDLYGIIEEAVAEAFAEALTGGKSQAGGPGMSEPNTIGSAPRGWPRSN